MTEEPSLPYYFPIAGVRIIGFIPFPRVCKMHSISSRIWTRVGVSISYHDNLYTTGTFIFIYECIDLSIPINSYASVYLSLCLSIPVDSYLSIYLSIYLSVSVSLSLSIYIYIYMYVCMYVCIREAFNKLTDFFVQAFKIVEDSWKLTMFLLYILWDDWPIFIISASNEQLQQQLEYTLLKPDCHSW